MAIPFGNHFQEKGQTFILLDASLERKCRNPFVCNGLHDSMKSDIGVDWVTLSPKRRCFLSFSRSISKSVGYVFKRGQ